METEPYRKALRKRKVWIEPLFAEGKLWHGMRRFRTRTLKKVNTEALMTATGQNIKRLYSPSDAEGRRSWHKRRHCDHRTAHGPTLLTTCPGIIAGNDASTHAFQHAGPFSVQQLNAGCSPNCVEAELRGETV